MNGEPITAARLRELAAEFPAPAKDPLALPDLATVTIGGHDVTTTFKVRFTIDARPFVIGLDRIRESLSGLAPKVAGFYAALQRPEPKRASRPRSHHPHRRPNRARRLRGR